MGIILMRKPRNAFLWLTVLWLSLCRITTVTSAPTAEQIAEKALAATVYLEMTNRNGKTLGIGSGFFVGQNQIATNFHVIEGSVEGTAKQVGKYTKYPIEGIFATDQKNDLAILKVTAFRGEPLPLGDSDRVKIGETVYVAGNPRGLEGTFSDGIISSIRGSYPRKLLQMTAPISPGSSGGPVLNAKGEVIGVSFMIIEGGQNLNFAIPSNYLKALLKQSQPVKPFPQGAISAETYFIRGYVNDIRGNYGEAIAAYTEAIRLKPSDAAAYVNRGVAKGNLGQYVAAKLDYDAALRLNPGLAAAYHNRGIAKDRLGEHVGAISDYDAALRLKPDLAAAYVSRGNAKSDLGEHVGAISDYDAALRLKPDLAAAYVGRGLAKGDLGEHVAAILDFDAVLRLKPDDAAAYVNRGNAKGKLGQYFAAITDYDAALRLKPDLAAAYYNRGVAKGALGQYFAAISDFDTVLRLKPDDAAAYVSRGLAKDDLGEHVAAISDYDAALRLKPDYAAAYVRRGNSKSLLDRIWEAKKDLRTALWLANRAGDESLKSDIEKLLKQIE